ncbi:hypothetical protein Smic_31730 [Streptomyces microflavus]|uniref:Uncharacterized protein n=1 Tax=Streptomyces microflavus TaxID=1919 RepID=A0A7J0CS89_STRMI|nr:hypothetical protein Smic_31730 [Streptomyces microflavus]
MSVSSSGLIYAVIVGAWAAYLVPMWLRRQDELNEARPTERFSTAIRLLSGRAAMERRYARELQERTAEEAGPDVDPDAETDRMDSVDVRAFAAPPSHTEARVQDPAHAPAPRPPNARRTTGDRRINHRRISNRTASRRTVRRTTVRRMTAGPVSVPRIRGLRPSAARAPARPMPSGPGAPSALRSWRGADGRRSSSSWPSPSARSWPRSAVSASSGRRPFPPCC